MESGKVLLTKNAVQRWRIHGLLHHSTSRMTLIAIAAHVCWLAFSAGLDIFDTAMGVVSQAHAAERQAYPVRPVRLIVPFAPGGSNDIMARLIGQKFGESLGQQVVVDNRAGASGIIGTELAAKAPADGYTLLMHIVEMDDVRSMRRQREQLPRSRVVKVLYA